MKMKTMSRIIYPALLLTLLSLYMIKCEKMSTFLAFKSNYKIMKQPRKIEHQKRTQPKTPTPSEASQLSSTDGSKEMYPTQSSVPRLAEMKYKEKFPDNVPILYQRWVHYFHYKEGAQVKPKTFFKNELYEKQIRQESGSDKFGSLSIPSEKSFFAVVYQDNVNFLTSRDRAITTVWDSLQIDFIKSIPENDQFMGGVKDLGVFSEGSCFQVITLVPPKDTFFKMSAETPEPPGKEKNIWTICADNDVGKINLMNIIIKLKLKKQHNAGVYLTVDTQKSNGKKKNSTPSMISDDAQRESINDHKRSPNDGFWVLLQDWTQCTQKCGGGKQVRHLMCIPPKKGGKPCAGEEIRERPCNTQPCPTAQSIEKLMEKEKIKPSSNILQKVEKPIVSVMSISKRPQRYDKCYIKDSDALMVKNDKDKETAGYNIPQNVPVRLVMNNKSVVAYLDENLASAYKTFLLDQTIFLKIKDNNQCFVLQTRNDKALFCRVDSDDSDFVNEWDYDFNLFKNQCHQERKTVSKEEQEELNQLKKRMEELKQEFIHKKIEGVKQNSEKQEEIMMEKKVQQAQTISLVAVQKEQKMEELLEFDEEQREKEQMEALQAKLEEERKRKERLMKTINEKSMEMQYDISKTKETNELERIKDEAKRQILAKRAAIKEKIQSMRKKNERKMEHIKTEIMKLRTETAGSLQKMAKKGNMSNCFNPEINPEKADEKIEEYCSGNYSDNFAKFTDCKKKENFCYACCEKEFGVMHMVERENCYSSICDKTKEDIPSEIKKDLGKNVNQEK